MKSHGIVLHMYVHISVTITKSQTSSAFELYFLRSFIMTYSLTGGGGAKFEQLNDVFNSYPRISCKKTENIATSIPPAKVFWAEMQILYVSVRV